MNEKELVRENELAAKVLDKCFLIHRKYGPGLLESVYETLLAYELRKDQIPITTQQRIPLIHENLLLECSFKADIIVEGKLIVELKAVDCLAPIHTAQTLTYLKLTGLRLALLINFNEAQLKDGIKRVIL